jgi:hypothetical protein
VTTIAAGKSVTRKTAVTIRRRPLVVTLHAGFLELRSAGTRTAFAIGYEAVYTAAAKLAADKNRAERAAARKGKRAA